MASAEKNYDFLIKLLLIGKSGKIIARTRSSVNQYFSEGRRLWLVGISTPLLRSAFYSLFNLPISPHTYY